MLLKYPILTMSSAEADRLSLDLLNSPTVLGSTVLGSAVSAARFNAEADGIATITIEVVKTGD